MCILYAHIPHDKLLDILYKLVDFVFNGGTRDYIVINKEGCASWSSKKRRYDFVFPKPLLKEAIKFLLHSCFFSIQIPIGSNQEPFFANLFLAHKEVDWVKAQCKLGTIIVQKINISFLFIDNFLSLNDDNSWASFLDIYIYIENGEFHTKLFDKLWL